MSSRDVSVLADEAREILDETLTESDRDELRGIYRDITGQIKWGKVLDEVFPIVLEKAEELLDRKEVCKNGDAWFLVDDKDKEFFKEEDEKYMSRRHGLLLLLAKKMMGGLKTRINQALNDIPILSVDEEIELEDILDTQASFDRSSGYVPAGGLELEMAREVAIEVDIAPVGKEGRCQHARADVRYKQSQKVLFKVTRCKDCKQLIHQEIVSRREKPANKECLHEDAIWVEGQEGQSALCSGCLKPVPNPEIYRWAAVGLEPVGDNPANDEVITLCSKY